jgi:hypothetical protein
MTMAMSPGAGLARCNCKHWLVLCLILPAPRRSVLDIDDYIFRAGRSRIVEEEICLDTQARETSTSIPQRLEAVRKALPCVNPFSFRSLSRQSCHSDLSCCSIMPKQSGSSSKGRSHRDSGRKHREEKETFVALPEDNNKPSYSVVTTWNCVRLDPRGATPSAVRGQLIQHSTTAAGQAWGPRPPTIAITAIMGGAGCAFWIAIGSAT